MRKIFILLTGLTLFFNSQLVSSNDLFVWTRPEVFSPNNDDVDDFIKFYFYSKEKLEVILRIFNKEKKVDFSYKLTLPSGKSRIIWDGKDKSGKVVPDGTYTYIVESEIGEKIIEKKGKFKLDRSILWKMPKKVLAFYYPWYRTKDFSGFWSHWGCGVPDLTKKKGHSEISTTHIPKIGLYDSSNPESIKRHIKMAEKSGIDVFICSWWGEKSETDDAFKVILNVAEKSKIKFTIYYELVPDESPEAATSDFIYILENYSRSPAFFKVKGQPVIFVYSRAMFHLNSFEWREVLSKVKKEYPSLFIADLVFNELPSEIIRTFDGGHTYNPVVEIIFGKDMFESYRNFVERARRYKKIACVTVIPGYDDSYIDRKGPMVCEREDGRPYEELFKKAILSKPDWILITSFNEWHEGSEIEPSVEYEDLFIKLTSKYTTLFKRR